MKLAKRDWKRLRLGDCVTMLSGGTPSKANDAYWSGQIPWVSCKDIKVERLFDAEDHLSVEGSLSGTRLVAPGTILLVVRGMILAKEFPVAIAMREMTFNQDLKALKCSPCLSERFIFYWLKSKTYDILGLADEAAHGTKRLQTDRLQTLAIDVPPKATQEGIVSVLSAYDDLIENNTRRIKILEEMGQRIYREWFVHFRFPGHENVRTVESELGPIPEGWRVGTVSQIAILHREGINPADFPDEFFLHYSIPSFDNNRTPVTEKGAEIKSNKYRVVPGCVLLSKLNPRILRLWMPPESSGLREITSTEFLVLTAPVEHRRTYLFQFLSSEEFNGSLTGLSLGTSTSHQRVKPGDFLNLPSLFPACSVVDGFCRNVDPMTDEIPILRSKNANLRATRDLLLPKLISGEISVDIAEEALASAAS